MAQSAAASVRELSADEAGPRGLAEEERARLEGLFRSHGFSDWRWLDPRRIVVAQWVRMKCMFGCDTYGRGAACPPNTPSVDDCRRFFDEYQAAAVFHFQKAVRKPEERGPWSRQVNLDLVKLEHAVFLAGHRKALLLFMDSCRVCAKCAGTRAECKAPESARPSVEGMAVDVFATVRPLGYPIEVLTDYQQAMNRYALLLVE